MLLGRPCSLGPCSRWGGEGRSSKGPLSPTGSSSLELGVGQDSGGAHRENLCHWSSPACRGPAHDGHVKAPAAGPHRHGGGGDAPTAHPRRGTGTQRIGGCPSAFTGGQDCHFAAALGRARRRPSPLGLGRRRSSEGPPPPVGPAPGLWRTAAAGGGGCDKIAKSSPAPLTGRDICCRIDTNGMYVR